MKKFFAVNVFLLLLVIAPPVLAQNLQGDILKKTKGVARETYNVQQVGTTQALATVGALVQSFIAILGVAATILIIYAGYLWLTAGGNENQVGTAKKILKQVIIGTIIVFLAYGIVSFVFRFDPNAVRAPIDPPSSTN